MTPSEATRHKLSDLAKKWLDGELTMGEFQNMVRATIETAKPEQALPNGTLFRHYKDGALYRVLFEANAGHGVSEMPYGRYLILARVATNNDGEPYRVIQLFAAGGAIWAPLHYKSVIYVSQTTLEVYARKREEFYGWVEIDTDHPMGGSVRRFEPVTT